MIISKLVGGLGNQMFQYAAGRSLAVKNGYSFFLDLSWYDNLDDATPRQFELAIFPVEANRAAITDIKRMSQPRNLLAQRVLKKLYGREIILPSSYCREPYFQYWEGINKVSLPAYLDGYWQSEKYFANHAELIREEFIFPNDLELLNAKYAEQIACCPNSVSVHVRRGDYLASNAAQQLCSIEYYDNALAYLDAQLSDPHYFFFSDDTEWVQETFTRPNMTVVVGNEGLKSFRDMQLMSMCRHNVIANSSFSWWGAWLGTADGLVIAPERWFVEQRVTDDLYCPNWKKM